MLNRRPLKHKLMIGSGLLLGLVLALFAVTITGGLSYRQVARDISARSAELPLAIDFSLTVTELRHTLNQAKHSKRFGFHDTQLDLTLIREDFRTKFLSVQEALRRYEEQLNRSFAGDSDIGDDSDERNTIGEIHGSLHKLDDIYQNADWFLNEIKNEELSGEVDHLHMLAKKLPSFLIEDMQQLKDEVRGQYRLWISASAVVMALTVFAIVFAGYASWRWLFSPLRTLMDGSRRVANGDFDHRIQLDGHAELAILADAMNAMTHRFQAIESNLNDQVQDRTRQVVRSEQLASVGFLAAGVAHEINNPLASIAFCAESLRSRINEGIDDSDNETTHFRDCDVTVLQTYLGMIEEEAFRCKEITERLLDFSRLGDVEKTETDVRDLVQGVIDMVRHLGKYREKNLIFEDDQVALAPVNGPEIKQVVLNLITNALDSIDPGGTVLVKISEDREQVKVTVKDDGCGMTDEVRRHLFEPFFTRRRDGQGTGLGLSISYRIVSDHGGQIDAWSEGPGLGSEFSFTLPCREASKRNERRHQAA
ncbi:HAMP domain-containing sensor histidine kinase [Bremerella cremea]|uniref:sensor histidine kinase n=1 Tax=Bremerella cremea TaxID=1031537 RepID=UPI0031ECFE07